jgi:hypothetical protein
MTPASRRARRDGAPPRAHHLSRIRAPFRSRKPLRFRILRVIERIPNGGPDTPVERWGGTLARPEKGTESTRSGVPRTAFWTSSIPPRRPCRRRPGSGELCICAVGAPSTIGGEPRTRRMIIFPAISREVSDSGPEMPPVVAATIPRMIEKGSSRIGARPPPTRRRPGCRPTRPPEVPGRCRATGLRTGPDQGARPPAALDAPCMPPAAVTAHRSQSNSRHPGQCAVLTSIHDRRPHSRGRWPNAHDERVSTRPSGHRTGRPAWPRRPARARLGAHRPKEAPVPHPLPRPTTARRAR